MISHWIAPFCETILSQAQTLCCDIVSSHSQKLSVAKYYLTQKLFLCDIVLAHSKVASNEMVLPDSKAVDERVQNSLQSFLLGDSTISVQRPLGEIVLSHPQL